MHKCILSLLLILLSCQHGKAPDSDKLRKKAKYDPYAKYQACLEKNPKSINCHWEIGWLYYTQAKWKEVFHHWNVARYVSRRKKFQDHIDKKLLLIQDLMALENLTKRYSQQYFERHKDYVRLPASEIDQDNIALSLNAVGDIMIGSQRKDEELTHLKTNPFSKVKDIFDKNDLNFGNLEGMFCKVPKKINKCKKDSKKSCYSFKTPPEYFDYISNTFNLVSLANNHALDYGMKCLGQTRKLLTNKKIPYSDGFKKPAIFNYNNLKIGFIAFHTSKHVFHNINNIKDAKQKVAKLSKQVDITIVSFHGGAEGHEAARTPAELEIYYDTKRGEVIKFSHSVIDAGADIVLGHGPHIFRGIELYKNRLISYSLGNFATYGEFNLTGLLKYGLVLNIKTDKDGKFINGKIISTEQFGKGLPKTDPKTTALNYIRTLSLIDFPKSKIGFDHQGNIYRKTKKNNFNNIRSK